MRISLCMTAKKCYEKGSLGMEGKNGEKPKIQITESVKIGNHSTVFSAVNHRSPNLSTPYSSYRRCYMVMQGTNGKPILIQMAPSERFGRFGPVLDIQLLKGSKFVVMKSVKESSVFAPLKPVTRWIGGNWEIALMAPLIFTLSGHIARSYVTVQTTTKFAFQS